MNWKLLLRGSWEWDKSIGGSFQYFKIYLILKKQMNRYILFILHHEVFITFLNLFSWCPKVYPFMLMVIHKEVYYLLYCEVNKYQILLQRLIIAISCFLLTQELFFDLLNYEGIQCCLYLIFIWSFEIWYCLLGLPSQNLWFSNWHLNDCHIFSF